MFTLKMRFDKDSLRNIAQQCSPTKEGCLFYKTDQNNYKERWFRLCSNLLFYYNARNSPPPLDCEPSGVLVMESFVPVRDNESLPNAFFIMFLAEPEVRHHFCTLNGQHSNEWFENLSRVSYAQQRQHLSSLRNQIKEITGADPLQSTPWFDKK